MGGSLQREADERAARDAGFEYLENNGLPSLERIREGVVDRIVESGADTIDSVAGGGGYIQRAITTAAGLARGAWYGNWGGPGYSAGRRVRADEPINPRDWSVAAKDALDQRFKLHDLRYARAATLPVSEQKAALRKADEDFIREARADMRAGLYPLGAQTAAVAAITLFRGKLTAGSYEGDIEPVAGDPRRYREYYDLILDPQGSSDRIEAETNAPYAEFGGSLSDNRDDLEVSPQDARPPRRNFVPGRPPARPSGLALSEMRELLMDELATLTSEIAQAVRDEEDD